MKVLDNFMVGSLTYRAIFMRNLQTTLLDTKKCRLTYSEVIDILKQVDVELETFHKENISGRGE